MNFEVDLEALRDDTPACREVIHLNNAGAALMPEPVGRAIRDHLDLETRIGGYEAHDARCEEIRRAYESVATLLGAEPRNLAFTDNATTAYAQALSSIPFEPGDAILTTRNDYVSNQIQFLSLRKRLGIRVLRAPDLPGGGVDLDAMAHLAESERPLLVAMTHVPTSSGRIEDVAAMGRVCRKAGLLFLVDACQSVGQMPVDAGEIGCDFLSATARKFLRGPRGVGFLYVADRVLDAGLEPLFVDLRGASWVGEDRYRPEPTARRFETWEFSWALVLGTGAAARYAQEIGLEAIRDRVRSLAHRLREGLREVPGVRVLDRGSEPEERDLCALVLVAVEGRDPEELVRALRERKIHTSSQSRETAWLHYSDREVSGALRFSPHCYNTEEEIDAAVAALGDHLQSTPISSS